jgi:hypothetical protein
MEAVKMDRDYILGVDLANGPDWSVESDGTVRVNPYYEITEG